jgi:hypothetical protein
MAIIIGGHPRSGTTLLQQICNNHPDVTVTLEFANFTSVGSSFTNYSRSIFKHWWRHRKRSFLVNKAEKKWDLLLQNHVFVAQYLFKINQIRSSKNINLEDIEATLKAIFPKSCIVGDKMPSYVFNLDKLAKVEKLKRIIIYRNCLDVTSSTLQIQTAWLNNSLIRDTNSVESIAKQWVKAIELMEKHAEKLHIIRYENLIENREQELDLLGKFLEIDSQGFPRIGTNKSIDKYQSNLSEQDIETVMKIAGSTMERLGYGL